MFKNKRLRKSKYTRTITIITLLLTFTISIGFSALRETLNISSGATFSPPLTLKIYTEDDTSEFRNRKYQENIITITFEDEINIPNNAIETWDIGTVKNGKIMAYVTSNEENTEFYDLHIQSNGMIPANPNMSNWFSGFYSVEEIKGLESLDTSNTTNMENMFENCYNLKNITGLENLNVSNVTNMSGMFNSNGSLETINLSNWDTSNVIYIANMFSYCYQLKNIIGLSDLNTSNIKSMSWLFYHNQSLESLDLSKWDTSNVIDMTDLFYHNDSLTTLDISNWDTSQVTEMHGMFEFCYNLAFIKGLEDLNTSNVTNMGDLFYDNQMLTTIDVRNWDTSSLIDVSHMFDGCENLTSILGIENFDTSKIKDMGYIFSGTNLTTLDLSNWDTSNVEDMSGMFYSMTELNSIIGLNNFDTSNVTDMTAMFYKTGYNSTVFTLDLSNFDTSSVTRMWKMFRATGYNSKNFNLILGEKFDTRNVTNTEEMFFSTGYSSTILDIAITIRNPNTTNYYLMFSGGLANKPGTKVTVNYTNETSDLVNDMIATKNQNANVVKGYNIDSLITFTIDDKEYNAYEGMTWEQWVNSEFNTLSLVFGDCSYSRALICEFVEYGPYIANPNNPEYILNSGGIINRTDVINPQYDFYLEHYCIEGGCEMILQ